MIFVLTVHRKFGLIILPYHKTGDSVKSFITLGRQVISADHEKYSPAGEKIIALSQEYSDKAIFKAFSKDGKDLQQFLRTVDERYILEHIRPYIEKRLVKIISLLSDNKYRLYLKEKDNKNIHPENEIFIENNKAETVFNFIRDENGLRYFLTVRCGQIDLKLTGADGILVTNSPCRLVLQKRLYCFQNDAEGIDGKKLLPFFKKEYIPVPASAENKYFKSFILHAVEKFKINAEGFDIIEISPVPQPLLSLENDLSGSPALMLKFDYQNGEIFDASNEKTVHVRLKHEDDKYRFIKLLRDQAREAAFASSLNKAGLEKNYGSYYFVSGTNDKLPKEKLISIINWIPENRKFLDDFKCKIVQDRLDIHYFTGKADIRAEFAERQDWFDIRMIVKIGEFEFPFVRFKEHILSNIPEFTLPNGDIFVLPGEWFEKYRELYLFGKQSSGGFIMNRHHFTVLENLKVSGKKFRDFDFKHSLEGSSHHATSLPDNFGTSLRNYQLTGFRWLDFMREKNLNACLADDMGLGKTVQTLALLLKCKQENKNYETGLQLSSDAVQLSLFEAPVVIRSEPLISLIVVPSSLVHNWANEIRKFTPELSYTIYTGTERLKNMQLDYLAKKYDIIITTYGIVRNDLEKMKMISFYYLILDESQNIKNPVSKTYQAITEIKSRHKLVLTGTPVENSLTDLWAQLNFLNPGLLGSLSFFNEQFVFPAEKKKDHKAKNRLRSIIQPFILRRTKEEVAPDLPPLTEQTIYCEMTDEHRKFYESEKSRIRNYILENFDENNKKNQYLLIINAITKLRQIANHPVLINRDYVHDSGKFEEVVGMLESIIAEKNKALVISSFVKHLKLFSNYFVQNGIPFCMLTGSTKNREEVIRDFQENREKQVFLVSLKAGGYGLNLTAAGYVLILDPWWNPASENQAVSRAHRIGQDKKVFAYRFITAGTIEEKIEKLKARKSDLFMQYINQNNPFKTLEINEILQLI
ncbi:MAG: DEAD/DEAH box helicase [Bacteroidia bacterium]|nr:DEAD/DEAH box helicase [Bacteroidia bacterium]